MNYRFELRSTNDNSDKYGNCEVCGLPCSEVFHLMEEREYQPSQWTASGCRDQFGHEACLRSPYAGKEPELLAALEKLEEEAHHVACTHDNLGRLNDLCTNARAIIAKATQA